MIKNKKIVMTGLGFLLIATIVSLRLHFIGNSSGGSTILAASRICVESDGPACYVISGTVTETTPSCEDTRAYDYGKDADSLTPDTCDGPGSIKIDDIWIYTSSGFVPDGFSVDVSKIRVGNKVTAKYILNNNGHAQLRCGTCGIIKE